MDKRMHWSPQREEEIFHAALEVVSPKERAAYLHQVCEGDDALEKHLTRLLAHSEVGDDLLGASLEVAALESPTSEGPGTIIGHYKLLEQIGEGGMGVVYMAEQEQPVRRRVALKIIKLGMDTKRVVARFEAERQALALMDHPHIAKILDAGATDTGQPFFAMELVRGIPISPDGSWIATVGTRAFGWDTATLSRTSTFSFPRVGLHSAVFSPDGRRLVAGGDSRCIAFLWDAETGMELVRLPGKGQLVNRVAFSHDGQFLAASSSAAGVVVYDGRRSEGHWALRWFGAGHHGRGTGARLTGLELPNGQYQHVPAQGLSGPALTVCWPMPMPALRSGGPVMMGEDCDRCEFVA